MKRRCLSKRFFGTIDTKTEGEVRMMKTIAVVAVHKDFAEFIKADLRSIFRHTRKFALMQRKKSIVWRKFLRNL